MKKIHFAILCLTFATILLLWGIGLSVDAFASPIFSSFWWISYESSHAAMFLALPTGATIMLIGVNYWTMREKKTKLPT